MHLNLISISKVKVCVFLETMNKKHTSVIQLKNLTRCLWRKICGDIFLIFCYLKKNQIQLMLCLIANFKDLIIMGTYLIDIYIV